MLSTFSLINGVWYSNTVRHGHCGGPAVCIRKPPTCLVALGVINETIFFKLNLNCKHAGIGVDKVDLHNCLTSIKSTVKIKIKTVNVNRS